MNSETANIEYPQPQYSVFETSRVGMPAVIVVNAALKEFAHRDVFPWHLSVIIDALELGARGVPTKAEYQILDAVGDVIEHAVLQTRNAIFLARETWGGQRQILFRVKNREAATQALQALTDRGPQKRDWEFQMVEDQEWSHASRYLSLLENSATESND